MIKMVSGHFPRWTGLCNCHESNFYLRNALFSSIPCPFEQRICFIKCEGRLGQFLNYFTFSLHSKDFFHQSSF